MFKSLEDKLLICLLVMLGAYALMYKTIICPSEIRPYANKFIAEAKARNVKIAPYYLLRIKFSSLEQGVLGVSYDSYSNRNKDIEIDRASWVDLSEEQKIVLVAHELGHALLHRKHISDKIIGGAPLSIMYPSVMSPTDFSLNEEHYWAELFSKRDDLE